MSDLAGLIERVREAKGPDREIDRAVFFALFCKPIPAEGLDMEWLSGKKGDKIFPTARRTHYYDDIPTDGTLCPAYTASIDAALGLVERLLPGEGIVLETHGINRAGIGQSGRNPAVGASPALAILAALLSALSQTEKQS